MKLKDTGLTAEELKDIVKKYMVETYARYDFIAERAEGMYLYDEKGVAYLDFYGGVAVNLGFTALYNVSSALTEKLRSQEYDNLDGLIADVKKQYDIVIEAIAALD